MGGLYGAGSDPLRLPRLLRHVNIMDQRCQRQGGGVGTHVADDVMKLPLTERTVLANVLHSA